MSSSRNVRMSALLGTLVAIALPVAAIVALHRLGSLDWLRIDFGDIGGWARRSRLEDAIAAVMRYGGLFGAYWLTISSLVYLLARLSGSGRLIDATAVLTLPAVRRVTDRLVIGTLAVSTLAGPAIAVTSRLADHPTSADPIAVRLNAEDTEEGEDEILDLNELDAAALDGLALSVPSPPPPRGEVRVPESISIKADAHLEVIVTEGDHLWALAERRVSSVLGRRAADHEIAPYWREVISSNPELRSGDPDIIYPGEVIVLPPMD